MTHTTSTPRSASHRVTVQLSSPPEAAKATGEIGTGIGLSIVAKLVERWGGRLDLESAPGEGSRFFVSLPAGKEED